MEITINEALAKHNFLNKIVLKDGENELSKDLKVKIMKMRIALNKIIRQYEEDSKEAVEGLKPKGFDDLLQKQDKTEEEQKEFDKLYKKLVEDHNAFLAEKGVEKVEFDYKFTSDEYDEIVIVNSDEVEINGNKLSGADYLEIIYALFVE